ncbi:hypothetical protein PR202_gb18613 [Eleusine coracana subsp. coracana]|uniref:H(+)/Pi cotransporter n=1 Tax=Eleusine coracana subsp. coracana TaxID=191504 RepID=A0AAV5F636_ELECO|nr:hypothetical protein PR202_gb18613 [Eleusine coracana subsp. coracana]
MAGGQLNVLSTLDQAKTQWYHFLAIVIAGMGFFTDAYDLFCIALVTRLLGRIYYTDPTKPDPGSLPPKRVGRSDRCRPLRHACRAAVLRMARRQARAQERLRLHPDPLMVLLCSMASGLSFGHTPKSVIGTLCFFRFWLGFGIGGDYPLSATIMSEYANKKTRGAFIAAVFAMQGFGILFGTIAQLWHSSSPGHSGTRTRLRHITLMPRRPSCRRLISCGVSSSCSAPFGTVPAALTYYWRMKMPETARYTAYTALIARNTKQAAADMSKVLHKDIQEDEQVEREVVATGDTWGLFSKQFLRRHGLHLLATTTTWFLLDIAFYSQNLFQKDIFTKVGWIPAGRTMNAIEEVFRISRAQALIALCGTVPGYWFTVAFIDIIGRFWISTWASS